MALKSAKSDSAVSGVAIPREQEPVAWLVTCDFAGNQLTEVFQFEKSARAWIAVREGVPDYSKFSTTPLFALAPSQPPPPAQGWQSIDTAPKDGTVILAWGRGDGPGAEPWVEKVCYFPSVDYGDEDIPLDAHGWTFDADGCKVEPEGWQALPSPPAVAVPKEPTKAQLNCGFAFYGEPALCTCGTCAVPEQKDTV